jgi:Mn-dependent DtxR family transcriptional regulator
MDKHRTVRPVLSESSEDYLEAIVQLGGTVEQSVRSVDIAAHMEVSKASVSKAMASLKAAGMVEQPFYGAITLTDQGFAYGSRVLAHHRLVRNFLEKVLGVDPETAEREAHLIEHDLSDDTYEKFASYVESLNP